MISVVIPSYNSEKTIGRCLDSLARQSYKGAYEVILVDSSIDRTPRIVAERYPGVSLFHLDEKTDPGAARNIGIKNSSGDLLAFIDSDCVAERDWLDRIAAAHRSPYNVVGGSVRNGNDHSSLVAWAGYISEFREYIPEHPKREVTHIPTCNISYKRRVFDEHGFFQGKYYPQEDLVYNHSLASKGEKILFDPAITVSHHHRTVWREFLSHQERIGKITAKVLRTIDLEGSFIPRHPVLAAGLLPLLPLVKFVKTVAVFIRHQPRMILARPAAIAAFAVGLVYWGVGFSKGVYDKAAR